MSVLAPCIVPSSPPRLLHFRLLHFRPLRHRHPTEQRPLLPVPTDGTCDAIRQTAEALVATRQANRSQTADLPQLEPNRRPASAQMNTPRDQPLGHVTNH